MTTTIPKDMEIDPFYRYRRELLVVETCKGFTLLKNIDSISLSLDRNSNGIIKYLSTQLGTSNKKNSLKGIFSGNELELLIEKYINNFVICKQSTCGNPETYLNNRKMICKACGYSENIDKQFIKYF